MRDRRTTRRWRMGAVACAALALGACRDRAEVRVDEVVSVDTGQGGGGAGAVLLRLMAPDTLGWNATDTVRVVVTNTTAQPLQGAVLTLFVAAPALVPVDSAAPADARPQTTASGEGTRLTFAVPPIEPGRTAGFAQAVRTPPAPAAPAGGRPAPRDAMPTLYLVRASLGTRGGSPIGAAVQDTVRIRAGSEVVAGGCGNVGDVTVSRYGVGPVRIGMTLDELRSACPEARDTTWRGDEGMEEKGAVAAPGGKRIVAVLAGGKIGRIVIDQPGLRTSAGLSVGATVGDLRARYGRMCAGRGEGRVAVWFPNAPGLSFGLDTMATRRWEPARVVPDSIADDVAVGSFWVRQGTDDCPAGAGGGDR